MPNTKIAAPHFRDSRAAGLWHFGCNKMPVWFWKPLVLLLPWELPASVASSLWAAMFSSVCSSFVEVDCSSYLLSGYFCMPGYSGMGQSLTLSPSSIWPWLSSLHFQLSHYFEDNMEKKFCVQIPEQWLHTDDFKRFVIRLDHHLPAVRIYMELLQTVNYCQ